MHVHHALAAIHAGIIDVALVTHGENGWSARATGGSGTGRAAVSRRVGPGSSQFMTPYGVAGAPSNYSHAMTRHNHRYGTTPEDFAHIAVVTRQWATLNPRAVMYSKETNPVGGPITVEDVQNARPGLLAAHAAPLLPGHRPRRRRARSPARRSPAA